MATMRTRRYSSYTEIAADAWNRLAGDAIPFLRHEYLCALEESGSAAPDRGWMPRPLTLEDDTGRLLGAVPLWLKSHSFGELVYDFAWAEAYARAGLNYYPKLIAALPFSPVSSPRLLVAPDADRVAITSRLISAARELADELENAAQDRESVAEDRSLGLVEVLDRDRNLADEQLVIARQQLHLGFNREAAGVEREAPERAR